jgi:hypothetical protein
MKNWKGLTICVVLAQALTIFGQTGRPERLSSADEMLARQVPGGDLEYLTTTTIFFRSLGGVGAAGGMVTIRNCDGDNSKQAWQPIVQPLRRVLDTMIEADPRYRWQAEDGIINLLPADGEPALLGTRISKFRVKDITSALEALSKLLALPEVKKGMEDLHLKPGIAPISYWSSPNPKPFSVRCEGVTLKQALNSIARAQGRIVWDYLELHCAGKDEVVIRF